MPLVLAVDDDEATRKLTVRWLNNAKLATIEANTGEGALALAAENADEIDVVVLDVMMPGIDGFETALRLQSNPLTAHIPIVLLTAHATAETDILRGVESGAVDHVAKPYSGPVLVAKVRAMAQRTQAARDLRSQLRVAEENATIDPLTRLYNRRHFDQRLREAIAHTTRHHEPLGLVMLDLDRFKTINDTFGHVGGDRVLVHVADVIRSVIRVNDSAFRYGGEELVLILRGDATSAARASERLREALAAKPVRLGDTDRVITFSAGVAAASTENGFRVENLVARADEALYRAKNEGRDRTVLEATQSG